MRFATLRLVGHARPKGSWTPVMTRLGDIKFRPASNEMARWFQNARAQLASLWTQGPLEGALRCDLVFELPRRKTVARARPTGRYDGDIDKLIRGILDAATGIIYRDDSQVVIVTAEKRYTDGEPGVWLEVTSDI